MYPNFAVAQVNVSNDCSIAEGFEHSKVDHAHNYLVSIATTYNYNSHLL